MTPEEAQRYLLSLELFGMRFGLDRMRRLMTALGNPQLDFESIHVVGTNGKSSTVRMPLASRIRARASPPPLRKRTSLLSVRFTPCESSE